MKRTLRLLLAACSIALQLAAHTADVAAIGPGATQPDGCSNVNGSLRCDGVEEVIYTSTGAWQTRWVGTYAVETDQGWYKAFCLRDDLDSPGLIPYTEDELLVTSDGALISLDSPTISLNAVGAPQQYIADGGNWDPTWDGVYSSVAYLFGDGRGTTLAGDNSSDIDTDAAALWLIGKWVGATTTDSGSLFVDDLYPHPSDSAQVAAQYARAREMWTYATARRGPTSYPAAAGADYRIELEVEQLDGSNNNSWWTVKAFNAAGEAMPATVTITVDNGYLDAGETTQTSTIDVSDTGQTGGSYGLDPNDDATITVAMKVADQNPVLVPDDPNRQYVGANGAERSISATATATALSSATLVIRKTALDSTAEPANWAGYTFAIHDSTGNEVAGSPVTTGDDGLTAPALELPLGTYTVTETGVPENGLLLDETARTVELAVDGEAVTFTFADRAQMTVTTEADVEPDTAGKPIPTGLFENNPAAEHVTDNVTVSGSQGDDVTLTVDVHGPFLTEPDTSSCTIDTLLLQGDEHTVRANDTISITADRPTTPGWYSFAVTATRLVDGALVTHPCGGTEVFYIPAPTVATQAYAGTTSTSQQAEQGTTVRDEVTLEFLLPNTSYELHTFLYRPASDEILPFATLTFLANTATMRHTIIGELPQAVNAGEKIVFIERLFVNTADSATGRVLVAEHDDRTDETQTLTVTATNTDSDNATGNTTPAGGENELPYSGPSGPPLLVLLLSTALGWGAWMYGRYGNRVGSMRRQR